MVSYLELVLELLEIHNCKTLIAQDLLLATYAELLLSLQVDLYFVIKLSCSYTWSVPKLSGTDNRPLKVYHYAYLNLCELLCLLDHFNEYFVLSVLDSRHVDPEYVRALFYQLAYRFLYNF